MVVKWFKCEILPQKDAKGSPFPVTVACIIAGDHPSLPPLLSDSSSMKPECVLSKFLMKHFSIHSFSHNLLSLKLIIRNQMKVSKFVCNEGWYETKGFLRAKNTPKVPVACSCLSNGSRTPKSHQRNVFVFFRH